MKKRYESRSYHLKINLLKHFLYGLSEELQLNYTHTQLYFSFKYSIIFTSHIVSKNWLCWFFFFTLKTCLKKGVLNFTIRTKGTIL